MNPNVPAHGGPEAHSQPRRVTVIQAPSFSLGALTASFATLFHYRDLIYTLTLHRINVRYKQSVLGWAWALLQPLALMAIYTLIFSVVTRVPTNGTPYAVFVFAALLPWTFFATSLTNATSGFLGHTHLITKVYFPREIIPLTYVFAALFDLLIASVVLVAMMIWYGIAFTPHVAFALPVLLVDVLFASGLSIFLAAIQVRFRDVGLAIPLLIQVWMFATPVVYPLSSIPPRYRDFYFLNPMVGIVENFRRVVIEGIAPELRSFEYSIAISVLLFPLAFLFFKNREATMADVL